MKGKKTGGRSIGSQNKITKEVREQLKSLLVGELDNLQERLDNLKDKERLEIVCRLLPFVLPKMTEVDMKQENEKSFSPIEVIIHNPTIENKN